MFLCCILIKAQKLFIVSSDNKFGVINESGVEIIQAKYASIEEFDKHHLGWAKVCLDGLYGYMDKTGKIIIEPQYRSARLQNLIYLPLISHTSTN
jgi:hypothetical protein